MNKKNNKFTKKYGAKILPFKKLSAEYQYALIYYMVVNGAAWDVSPELSKAFIEFHREKSEIKSDLILKRAIKKSIQFYIDLYGDCKFGKVFLPVSLLKKNIMNETDVSESFEDFKDYHNWYLSGFNNPNHTKKNRWPCILSGGKEGYDILEDGWHRFHRYVQLGCRNIPCVFYT